MSQLGSERRKSCTFCRQRKMKCTGETPWCIACRDRCQPCVYETSISKPRRKRRKETEQPRMSGYPSLDIEQTKVEIENDSATHSVGSFFVLDELEDIFKSCWQADSELSARQKALGESLAQLGDPQLVRSSPPQPFCYNQGLGLILQEIMSNMGMYLSPLSTDPQQKKQRSWFQIALSKDNSNSILSAQPLNRCYELDERSSHYRTLQLIEYSFAQHPFLCMIVSKTLFLMDFGSQTHDPCLLNLILAESIHHQKVVCQAPIFFFEAIKSIPQAESFRQIALNILASRKLDPGDEDLLMTTIQSLVLLAWRELAEGSVKRALVEFGMASNLIRRATEERKGTSYTTKINGISLEHVEGEELEVMYTIVQGIILWASLHLGTCCPGFDNFRTSQHNPYVEMECPSLWKLDAVAGNISSLLKHAEAWDTVRVLSPIFHQVYGLFDTLISVSETWEGICPELTNRSDIAAHLHFQGSQLILEGSFALTHLTSKGNSYYTTPYALYLLGLHTVMNRFADVGPDRTCQLDQSQKTVLGKEVVKSILTVAYTTVNHLYHNVGTEHLFHGLEMSVTQRNGARAIERQMLVGCLSCLLHALEVISLHSHAIQSTRSEVKDAIVSCYEITPDAAELVRRESGRMVSTLGKLMEVTQRTQHNDETMRNVECHCKQLKIYLEANGIVAEEWQDTTKASSPLSPPFDNVNHSTTTLSRDECTEEEKQKELRHYYPFPNGLQLVEHHHHHHHPTMPCNHHDDDQAWEPIKPDRVKMEEDPRTQPEPRGIDSWTLGNHLASQDKPWPTLETSTFDSKTVLGDIEYIPRMYSQSYSTHVAPPSTPVPYIRPTNSNDLSKLEDDNLHLIGTALAEDERLLTHQPIHRRNTVAAFSELTQAGYPFLNGSQQTETDRLDSQNDSQESNGFGQVVSSQVNVYPNFEFRQPHHPHQQQQGVEYHPTTNMVGFDSVMIPDNSSSQIHDYRLVVAAAMVSRNQDWQQQQQQQINRFDIIRSSNSSSSSLTNSFSSNSIGTGFDHHHIFNSQEFNHHQSQHHSNCEPIIYNSFGFNSGLDSDQLESTSYLSHS